MRFFYALLTIVLKVLEEAWITILTVLFITALSNIEQPIYRSPETFDVCYPPSQLTDSPDFHPQQEKHIQPWPLLMFMELTVKSKCLCRYLTFIYTLYVCIRIAVCMHAYMYTCVLSPYVYCVLYAYVLYVYVSHVYVCVLWSRWKK